MTMINRWRLDKIFPMKHPMIRLTKVVSAAEVMSPPKYVKIDYGSLEQTRPHEVTASSNAMVVVWVVTIFAASALGSFAGELFSIGFSH